ncbi:MAG: monofunctional biosynthetic peptidoglycan transglycosylase [Candidatus Nephrothrix sp. EaCA]|nr:MAG: monofunctional biosynthetic peptidoglycan transglycosylase [Candidatus Nephrothrix sp. EaCA]
MIILFRIFKKTLRLLFLLFILQLVYAVLLRWMPPPVTLTQISSWTGGHGLRRSYVSLENISPAMRLAVMASEDQIFPDHNGFDWRSIQKAYLKNKKSKRMRGASTISQQTAKNVFLWQGRTWVRKALEVYYTFLIELVWGKKRIMEVYLNVAETGKGVFGVEAAAQKYFNKSAKELTRREASFIAACLPDPKRYGKIPFSNFINSRSAWILRQMNNLNDDDDMAELLK